MDVRLINVAGSNFPLKIFCCLGMKNLRIIFKSISWSSLGSILPHLSINNWSYSGQYNAVSGCSCCRARWQFLQDLLPALVFESVISGDTSDLLYPRGFVSNVVSVRLVLPQIGNWRRLKKLLGSTKAWINLQCIWISALIEWSVLKFIGADSRRIPS